MRSIALALAFCASLPMASLFAGPNARIDVVGIASGVELRALAAPDGGSFKNYSWGAEDSRKLALTGEFKPAEGTAPAVSAVFKFVPKSSGEVELQLCSQGLRRKGMTEQDQAWTLFESVEVSGAKLLNGDFRELDAKGRLSDWSLAGGAKFEPGKGVWVWHMARCSQKFAVEAGKPVSVGVKARAGQLIPAQPPPPPLSFERGDWRLELDRGNGAWKSLDWRGRRIVDSKNGAAPFTLGMNPGKGRAFALKSWESDPKTGVLSLVHESGPWRVVERVEFDAKGMKGLIGRSATIVCDYKAAQGDAPARFENLDFICPFPKSGRYYQPVSFLGDSRGMRAIESDVQGDRFTRPDAFSAPCSSMKIGEAIKPNEYVMPLALELSPGLTVFFLTDDRRDPARQYLLASAQDVQAHQLFSACGWVYPGVEHVIGSAYMLLREDGVEAALANGAIWDWYKTVGFRFPAKRPSWLYDASVSEFGGDLYRSPESFDACRETLLPRLARLGFNCVWVMPVSAPHWYFPIDYMNPAPEAGTWAEYRAMVAKAHDLGIRVWQDIVPHGASPDYAKARGNSALALYYNLKGDASKPFSLDFKSPEWQEYIRKAAANFVNCGVDGFRIDMCGGNPPNWRREGFPARDKTPGNVDKDWWLKSLDAVGGKVPALPYERASLCGREGGLEIVRTVRQAVKAARPDDGAVLAEVSMPIYTLEGDAIYDFMGRLYLFKMLDMAPSDFAKALALRLEEQKLTDPEELLRFRYVECHDGVPAKYFVGNPAARALAAMLFMVKGIPLANDSLCAFDIGNGIFLRHLNDVRKALPELRRGDAFYTAVDAKPAALFSSLRTFEGKASLGLVNFSADPGKFRLSVPVGKLGLSERLSYKLWNTSDGSVVAEGAPDSFKNLEIALPAWGSAVLCWRPGEEAYPLAAASKKPVGKHTDSTVLELSENASSLIVSAPSYRMTISKTSGCLESFSSPSGEALLGPARLLLGETPQASAPKVAASRGAGEIFIDATRVVFKNGAALRSSFICSKDAVRIKFHVDGEIPSGLLGLMMPAVAVDRYQVDSVEGRLDDWFSAPAPLKSPLVQAAPSYLNKPDPAFLWRSESQPLNPNLAALRFFRKDGSGLEIDVLDSLRNAPAGVAVLREFAGRPAWTFALFLRKPDTLSCDARNDVSIELKPVSVDSVPSVPSNVFRAGSVDVAHRSLCWRLANPSWNLDLSRMGGMISRLLDAKGEAALLSEDVYTDSGFGGKGESKRATPKFDYGTATRLWLDGDVFRMRFLAQIRNGNRWSQLTSPLVCQVEYAFDSKASFASAWSVFSATGASEKDAFLSWSAGNPAWRKAELLRGGTPFASGEFPAGSFKTLCSSKLPDAVIVSGKDARPLLSINRLRSDASPSGTSVQMAGDSLYFTLLNKSTEMPVNRWISTSCVFTPGSSSPDDSAPVIRLPSLCAKEGGKAVESFEEVVGGGFLLGDSIEAARIDQASLGDPSRWMRMSTSVRFDISQASSGYASLRMQGMDAIRFPFRGVEALAPGKYIISMNVKTDAMPAAGSDLRCKLFYTDAHGGEASLPDGTFALPSGNSGWTRVSTSLRIDDEAKFPRLRMWLGDVKGAVNIDDVGIEPDPKVK